MRPLRLMLIVTSISLICVLCCSIVSALNADEASVSLSWSSQAVYPNDTVSVTITFKSNSAEQLRIYRIGLQFDWMDSNEFYTGNFSDNPVVVPSQGIYIFDQIVIQVPLGTSPGPHSYFVGIDGTEGSSASSFSWNSPSFTIEIHDIIESIYNDVLPMFESKLNEAKSANYASSEAQSLLQQAQVEFEDNAKTFASQGNWSEALISLNIADGFLDQAYAAEQSGGGQQAGLQSLLFYLAIIAIVVIIVVSIIIVVVRRRRRQAESGADQPVETIEEQSEEQG